MSQSTANIELESLLRDMYESLTHLSLTLEDEYQALAATNVDVLQKSHVTKLHLTELVEMLEQKRTQLLVGAKLPVTDMGMLALLNLHTRRPDNHLFSLWDMIKDLSRQCSDQNTLNGVILEHQQHHVHNALAILTGRSQLQSDTYNARGKSAQNTSGQTLARA